MYSNWVLSGGVHSSHINVYIYIFFMGDLKNTYILGKINPKNKSLAHANIFKVRTTAFGEPCVHCED